MKKSALSVLLALVLAACGSSTPVEPPAKQPDDTPPTLTLEASRTTVSTPGNLLLTAQATDPSGIEEVRFYQDGRIIGTDTTAPYDTTVNVTSAMNGPVNFLAQAVDGHGNTVTKSITVNINVGAAPDTMPPQAQMIVNTLAFTQPGTLDITVTAKDDGGISKVEFYEGEALLATDTTAPYEHAVEFKGASANGDRTFRAWVVDNAGNPAEVKTTVSVNIPDAPAPPPADTTPPTLTVSATPGTLTAAGDVTISADAGDAGGISKVEFYRGEQLLDTDTQAPYRQAVRLDRASNGTVTFRVRAVDASGNAAEQTASVQVEIPAPADTEPPVVELRASHAQVTEPVDLRLSAEASDTVGVVRVEFYEGNALLTADTATPYTHVVRVDHTLNGSRSYRARAVDAAGNAAESFASVMVAIPAPDTTPPTLNVSASTTTVTDPGTIMYVGANAEDAGGVARLEFHLDGQLHQTSHGASHTLELQFDHADSGEHELTVRAFDAAGNVTEESVPFTVEIPAPSFDPAAFEGEWEWSVDHFQVWSGTARWDDVVTEGPLTVVKGTHGPECFANTVEPCGGEITVTHDARSNEITVRIFAHVQRCFPSGEGGTSCSTRYDAWLEGTDADHALSLVNGKPTLQGLATLSVNEDAFLNPFVLRRR